MALRSLLKFRLGRDPIASSIKEAQTLLIRSSQGARTVRPDIIKAIETAAETIRNGPLSSDVRTTFLTAYADLVKGSYDISTRPDDVSRNTFEDVVDDAEILVRYAIEAGVSVEPAAIASILAARTAVNENTLDDAIRQGLFVAYASVSKQLGEVTAETIRSCSSLKTRKTLRSNRWTAIGLTALAALISLATFVLDNMSDRVKFDIDHGSSVAAKLRSTFISVPGVPNDPCTQTSTPAAAQQQISEDSIATLQDLAGTTREILGRTIWLNTFTANQECNPIASLDARCASHIRKDTNTVLEIVPAIPNLQAEILCKIRTFQEVRSFGENVRNNYAIFIGGITAYLLPILYSMLGAYSFRLRNFADTIKKKTYHPSFADSARMITAVIAGAISGLFNPARGLNLSPLATAFLVGYGVELFFKLLDALVNSFNNKSS